MAVAVACGLAGCAFYKDNLNGEERGTQIVPIPEAEVAKYPDNRPAARYRMDAKDQGVILKHGDGPNECDKLGAREAMIFEEKGAYHLFYDGAGPKGWLACLATSRDLKTWEKKGPALDFGKPGEMDSAAACSPWVYFDGKEWHMFYLGTPNVSPPPDRIPSFPYLTMKAKSKALAGPWEKQKDVVPFKCVPGTYYNVTASPGHILKQGDEYQMFFSASMKRTLGIARTKDLNGPWAIDPDPIVSPEEQIENSSLCYEKDNKTWFLFTNHIGLEGGEYTDAVWVYWTTDLNKWNPDHKAVVLDGKNCTWSRKCIGMPSVVRVGKRLAILYDAPGGDSKSHMNRDIGVCWLNLPLMPPEKDSCENCNKVSAGRMQQVYDEVKTPFKYGVVMRGEDKKYVDCPNVFRHNKKWYMMYVCMNKVGYETHLAESDDLLNWKTLGKILTFQKDGWDKWQADGGVALCDPEWGGSSRLEKHDGKYWMSYIGGALQGYEPDPLAIGMAWTKTPTEAREWTRIAGNPVLSRDQPDVRAFEIKTLYKSQIIRDRNKTLAHPFVMFYNGKIKDGYEKIGMAVSDDMVHWKRFGTEPVVSNGDLQKSGISGDPQIVRMGDLWVMFYFGANWKPGAFDTFACSKDLVHWTKWEGRDLIAPSEPWDNQYAHKPWLLKYKGVVYHYYCAVGNEGRVIALATSKDLKQATGKESK